METVINKLDEILVNTGRYHDKNEVMKDALRALLRVRPELKKEVAVELYEEGEISLSRGAEIAGVNIEDFKEILKREDIKIKVPDVSSEELEEEVEWILGVC